VASDSPTQQEIREVLGRATVGIIGLGGLGSHVSWMLLRAGVRTLVLADHDRVDADNLSRQGYYPDQVGEWKTEALAVQLRRIEPEADLTLIRERIGPDDLARYFGDVDVLVEAVDTAADKAALIAGATTHLSGVPLVGASGIAGVGPSDEIESLHLADSVWMVGDLASDADAGLPLLCSRVVCAAAKQAHLVIRILLGVTDP
jgi:sulfur carrier protein ThiS adenylyltransferase